MLKQQQKFIKLLNNTILTIDTIQKTAINGYDGYYNADKSFKEIVRLCDKLFRFVDNVRKYYSPDKSPSLTNLQ